MEKTKRDYQKEQAKLYNYCDWCKKRISHADIVIDMAIPFHQKCLKVKEEDEQRHIKNQRSLNELDYIRALRKHKGLRV